MARTPRRLSLRELQKILSSPPPTLSDHRQLWRDARAQENTLADRVSAAEIKRFNRDKRWRSRKFWWERGYNHQK